MNNEKASHQKQKIEMIKLIIMKIKIKKKPLENKKKFNITFFIYCIFCFVFVVGFVLLLKILIIQ